MERIEFDPIELGLARCRRRIYAKPCQCALHVQAHVIFVPLPVVNDFERDALFLGPLRRLLCGPEELSGPVRLGFQTQPGNQWPVDAGRNGAAMEVRVATGGGDRQNARARTQRAVVHVAPALSAAVKRPLMALVEHQRFPRVRIDVLGKCGDADGQDEHPRQGRTGNST